MRFIFLCVFLVLGSCTKKTESPSFKAIIKVNDTQMSLKEFSTKMAFRLKELDSLAAKDPTVVERVQEEIIRGFIVRCLMLDWAKKKNIQISDDELDSETTRLRSIYPDDLAFRRMLAEESISFAEWQTELKMNLIEKKVSEEINKSVIQPKDDELRAYYNENKESFRIKERIFLAQIVLKDRARAEHIKSELKKDSFENLAKKYSIAPEAQKGGVVGWIEKGTVDFFDQAFKWPLNQVGEIIESPFGFHVVKVTKKELPRIPSYDEQKAAILRRVLELKGKSAYVSWVDKELRSSSVFRDTALIKALKIETKGSADDSK